MNLVLKTNWLGWRKSRTNLNFLPTATVRGLQQWGGLFTSIMQRFSKSSEMASSVDQSLLFTSGFDSRVNRASQCLDGL